MKSIYIVLTKSTTFLSRLVYFITRDKYTHVSISFEKELQPLYSSSRKNGCTLFPAGPCKESFYYGYMSTHKHIPCAVYELKVSDEVYKMAKREAEEIIENADEYHFNILGLLLCRLNIPYHRKNNYFCSQFVGEILEKSNAIKLPKDYTLMRPTDYMKLPELRCRHIGKLGEVA